MKTIAAVSFILCIGLSACANGAMDAGDGGPAPGSTSTTHDGAVAPGAEGGSGVVIVTGDTGTGGGSITAPNSGVDATTPTADTGTGTPLGAADTGAVSTTPPPGFDSGTTTGFGDSGSLGYDSGYGSDDGGYGYGYDSGYGYGYDSGYGGGYDAGYGGYDAGYGGYDSGYYGEDAGSSCPGYATPDDGDSDCECESGHSCANNGCYGGYYCKLSTGTCKEPPSGC